MGAVKNECWTFNFFYLVNDALKVISVSNFSPTRLFSSVYFNRRIVWHHTESAWIILTCQKTGRPRTCGAFKDDYIWLIDAHVLQAEPVDVLGVFFFLFFCSFSVSSICSITWVFYCKNTHITVVCNGKNLTFRDFQVFCFSVEVKKQPRWDLIANVEARDVIACTLMHLRSQELLLTDGWFILWLFLLMSGLFRRLLFCLNLGIIHSCSLVFA